MESKLQTICLVFLNAISFMLEGWTASNELSCINCICYCPVNDMRWPACSLAFAWIHRKWSWPTLSHYPKISEPWSAWSRTADVPSKCANVFLFLHWLYINGWDLPSSISFRHFSFDCALVLQFLQPTCAKSSSNLLHHLNFCLPLLLYPFSPGLVQRTFFAG